MLVIRKEQLEKLSEKKLSSFEDEMVLHLAEFSPPLFKVIKEDQMRLVVRSGFKKSEKYRFTLRGTIRLYLEMMLLFGSHFDTDPQYPWISEILSDRHSVSEMQRAEWLHEKITEYQEKVSGANGVNTRNALEKLSEIGKQPFEVPDKDFDFSIKYEMSRIFPQKVEYVGQKQISDLISRGRGLARQFELPKTQGDTLLTILAFSFGHGCTEDPLYPWIGNTLADQKITSPQARVDRLQRKAMTWLDHVIKGNLEETEL